MHEGLRRMLDAYRCRSGRDYENALREIVQEIALLGLWRAKFFEHAAFYGGSALRILYELDRFSEDLDFSLLDSNAGFSVEPYLTAVKNELHSFGFTMTVEAREKTISTPIRSALIKTSTRASLLVIETPGGVVASMHRNQALRIKLEIDVDPPGGFRTEARLRTLPIPFSVLSYRLPDLFAGKMSAVLCREWKAHVKGRDWYDLAWFIARSVPVNLQHLKARLVRHGSVSATETLNAEKLSAMLRQRIDATDFASARADVTPFVNDTGALELWSPEFFHQIAEKLITV